MGDFKGDYLGFTYGEKSDGTPMHSSDLGIVRTSDGSRFNENLLPTIQDKTVQVPGGDGTYYFGSYYTQRQFSVSFAFDELTEFQLRQLRAHFGDKKLHKLTFDEAPYKSYTAKVTGTAQIKHLVFNEGTGRERVYKGEGSIQFTCYQPYAVCEKKKLTDYVVPITLNENNYVKNKYYTYSSSENKFKLSSASFSSNKTYYENIGSINEWIEASGLKHALTGYDVLSSNQIKLYNPGDLDAHFKLRFKFSDYGTYIPAGKIYLSSSKFLQWEKMTKQAGDDYVVIDTRLNLIEGYKDATNKSGNLYNQHITEGEFFKIPTGDPVLTFDMGNLSGKDVQLEYCYYYF